MTEFEDGAAQVAALAEVMAAAISAGVRDRGVASLVVTGGTSPGPLYDALAQRDLPWSAVQVTLSDERWVAPDHPDSNERLVRSRLLQGPASAARFIPLKTEAPSPQEALERVEASVAALARPFDLVLLGMGDDAHVASLFPGVAEPQDLDPAGPRLVAPGRAPNGTPRISLTLRALVDARRVALIMRGETKRTVWRDAVEGLTPHLPVSALIRHAACPVEAYWAP